MKKLIPVLLCLLVLTACGPKEKAPAEDRPYTEPSALPPSEAALPIKEIVDLTELYMIDVSAAEEHFYEDAQYYYVFSHIMSQHVIVVYSDGSYETIVEALNAGRAQITDLDKFQIHYSREEKPAEPEAPEAPIDPNAIVSIVYDETVPTSEAVEPFWSDETGFYSFPSIRSHLITVTYADGRTEPVMDALNGGRITLNDLDTFGIHYYKTPRSITVQATQEQPPENLSEEESVKLLTVIDALEWSDVPLEYEQDLALSTDMEFWFYDFDQGILVDPGSAWYCKLTTQQQFTFNSVLAKYLPEETPDTQTPETPKPETETAHSSLYIEGVSTDDVIAYFNEVCLDAEFTSGGNASLVQKWTSPITYYIHGNPTEQDLSVLRGFVQWLNGMYGFPGMSEAADAPSATLTIHFCTIEELINILGDQYTNSDGGVTYWYENNAIYSGTICYRNEIDQEVRNSVILEEIFNGLGPVQDTWLRPDSIAYAGYSTPQSLTAVDELILKLLYHPDIHCGMNATECEAVIRSLYY